MFQEDGQLLLGKLHEHKDRAWRVAIVWWQTKLLQGTEDNRNFSVVWSNSYVF